MRIEMAVGALALTLAGCAEQPTVGRSALSVTPATTVAPFTSAQTSAQTSPRTSTVRRGPPIVATGADTPPPVVEPTPIAVSKVEVPGRNVAGVAADVVGVPPLRLAEVTADVAEGSTLANKAGLKANKTKDFPGALAQYLKALELNPGNIYARYNVACLFARTGDVRAKAVLAQLATAGCPLCLDRVAAAPKDKDFAAIKADPELLAMAKTAAERLAKHATATVAAELSSGAAPQVAWTSLDATAYPFTLGDRITLSWEKPVTVHSVAATCAEDPCSIENTVVTFPGARPQEPASDGRLETPVTTTSVTVMVRQTNMALGYGGHSTTLISVFGVPGPAPTVAATAPPPAATPSFQWDEANSTISAVGYPAISADGKRVAIVDNSLDDALPDANVTVRVLSRATGKAELKVLLIDPPKEDGATTAPDVVKERVTKAKAALLGISPTWRPLADVGGGDPWGGSSGLATGLYAALDDTSLRVIDVAGTTIHESDHPSWSPPAPRGDEEELSLRWGGVWVDTATKTIVVRAYYHPGVCAGGGYYSWYVVPM